MTDLIVPAAPAGAAGILYRVGDSVLLLLRGPGAKDYPLTWAFPGGSMEPGELAEQTALRESMEEIGAAPMAGLPIVDAAGGFVTFMATGMETFAPTLNHEHLGYVWAPLDALPTPLHPGCAATLSRQAPLASAAMDAAVIDGNGWREFKRNPISRVGVFPYSGKQLGLQGAEANKVFNVFRPPEELGHPDCIASFKLVPWVNDHTMLGPVAQEMLGATAQAAEQKGVDGVIGEDVYFDPESGYLFGNLKVFSDKLASLIAADKRELSAGYKCRYEKLAGTWQGQAYDFVQRQIRGNHLASVDKGRMGSSVAVQDRMCFSLDSMEIETMADDKTPPEGGEGGGGAGAMTVADAVKMVAELGPMLAKIQTALGGAAPATPAPAAVDAGAAPAAATTPAAPAPAPETGGQVALDAALKPLHDQIKALQQGQAGQEQAFIQRMNQRNALASKVSALVGTFDHAEMTLEKVAAYGCEKLGLKPPAGQEQTALDAYLAGQSTGIPAAQVAQDGADSKTPNAVVQFLRPGTAAKE